MSDITTSSGNCFFIVFIANGRRPFLLVASVAFLFFFLLGTTGKIIIAFMPNVIASFISLRWLSIVFLLIPGMEGIFSILFFPSITKIGSMRSLTVILVSWIKFLIPLLFLSLLPLMNMVLIILWFFNH